MYNFIEINYQLLLEYKVLSLNVTMLVVKWNVSVNFIIVKRMKNNLN